MSGKGSAGRVVYVVDDDAAVRRGIERLLRVSGYVCRMFESAKEYLAAQLEPVGSACMVLDIRMPDISGTELQELLRGTENEVPIVFVTGHGDIPTCVKALKAGAVSFLTKPFDESALLKAVSEALHVSEMNSERIARRAAVTKRYASMSPREREVFEGVVRGLLNKQIADEMGIAEKTVKVHRARVMEKMAADSVASLVRFSQLLAEPASSSGGV